MVLADEVLAVHAASGRDAERLAHGLLAAGRTVLTLADSANTALIDRDRGPTPIGSWAAYAAENQRAVAAGLAGEDE